MKKKILFFFSSLGRLLTIQLGRPSLNQVFKCLFFVGMAGLVFVLGAAVMFFNLPTSDYLRKAFLDARTPPPNASEDISGKPLEAGLRVDKPAQTSAGFTLLTTTSKGASAALVDMTGTVVHRWQLPFGQAWPMATHVKKAPDESMVHWFGSYLFPNGDLLAVYHSEGITPYGCGLIKIDKDSKLLWAFGDNVHHEVDVAADGTILAMTQKIAEEIPKGVNLPKGPFIADTLVVLSPEGKLRESLPILEAFRDSQFSLWLQLIDTRHAVDAPPGMVPFTTKRFEAARPGVVPGAAPPVPKATSVNTGFFNKGDYTHANSVRVIDRALAPSFPFFKEGQVLISFRNMDTLAVVDIPTRAVVWAARGLWRKQHSPQLLANGHILVFDNEGDPEQARVLEFDPVTQGIPWWYGNENSTKFKAHVRGSTQRLANGNTLIVDPDRLRLFEVTPSKEVVWDLVLPRAADSKRPAAADHILTARRYPQDVLTFLKPGTRARP